MSQTSNYSKNFIWNMIAMVVNSAEAVVILAVASRELSINDAGIMTMGFTLSNLAMMIGKYGMRSFQVTDISCVYSFKNYFGSRIITGTMTLIFVIGYILCGYIFWGYSIKKSVVIFCLWLIYAAEYFEDIYWGEYQKRGRLDVGAKMFSVRWICIMISVCCSLIFIKDALISVMIGAFVAWGLSLVFINLVRKRDAQAGNDSNEPFEWKKIINLMKVCLPLCISGLLNIYVVNAAKYSIDACMTDDIQACYGFISMPVFVVSVVNYILYQPILVDMAAEWKNGQTDLLRKRVIKQVTAIVVFTIICVVGGYFLGIPVLSILYATDLTGYKLELIILLVGGMFQAMYGFFLAINTILQQQKKSVQGHFIIAIIALVFTTRFVKRGGTRMAALINCVWLFMVMMWYGIVMIYGWKKGKAEK